MRFPPSDSCIVQLLSINHEGFRNSYCDVPKDTCGVFLDISKACAKNLHLVTPYLNLYLSEFFQLVGYNLLITFCQIAFRELS